MIIERQTIVTWYRPDEKTPPKYKTVIATISGKRGKNITYDHAFAEVAWYGDEAGFELEDIDLDEFTVHAWCDLEPYKG